MLHNGVIVVSETVCPNAHEKTLKINTTTDSLH